MRRYQVGVIGARRRVREYKRTMPRGLVPYAENWLAEERKVRAQEYHIYIYIMYMHL